MKITTGIQFSQIETDNPKILKALDSVYAKHIKGSEFTPSYKRFGWDGKKHFVSPTGKFRTGLLNFILKDLEKVGCVPDIENTVKTSSIEYNFENFSKTTGFKPYEFQENLVKLALKATRGIVKSPTGSGKTLIMGMLVDALKSTNDKIVILFNSKQLITQTYKFFTENLKLKDIGICFGEGFIEGRIMLCTIQSIEKIIDQYVADTTVLMVDEVHLFATGKVTLAAIESFPNAKWRFGFTATLPDDEVAKYNLYANFGEVIEEFTTVELINQGFLTKPKITMIKYTPDETKFVNLPQDYATIYEEYIVSNEDRNKIIIDLVAKIEKTQPESKVVILTKNLAHTAYLNTNIKNSLKLEGEDDIQFRYNTINIFREKGFRCLVGTKILETGVNIEEITHIILARGLKAESGVIQALGRGLRKHKSKNLLHFYDIYDSGIPYLEKHSKERKKTYKKEGHEVEVYEEL